MLRFFTLLCVPLLLNFNWEEFLKLVAVYNMIIHIQLYVSSLVGCMFTWYTFEHWYKAAQKTKTLKWLVCTIILGILLCDILSVHVYTLVIQSWRGKILKLLKAVMSCPCTALPTKFRNLKMIMWRISQVSLLNVNFGNKKKKNQSSKIPREIWVKKISETFLVLYILFYRRRIWDLSKTWIVLREELAISP